MDQTQKVRTHVEQVASQYARDIIKEESSCKDAVCAEQDEVSNMTTELLATMKEASRSVFADVRRLGKSA